MKLQPQDVDRWVAHLLSEYLRMMLQSTSLDPKEFGAHHTACKTALSHLEYLLKITRALVPPEPAADLHQLIEQASRALDGPIDLSPADLTPMEPSDAQDTA